MVMACNCEGSTKQEAVFLDPSRCKGNPESQENIVQRTIVFMPRPDKHEMFVCEASHSIQGGFASLSYQNILNNDDIQLNHETCKVLHSKPWAAVKIDKIPLSTMGANGLYTHVRLTPYKMGENLFTRQVGSVNNEGYCTGQGITYHGLQYDREKATVTIRIKLSRHGMPRRLSRYKKYPIAGTKIYDIIPSGA
jgi:hypothetical protein